MDAGTLLILIAEIILFWVILTAIQYPLRKEEHRSARTAVFVVKVLMIPAMALLQISIESPLPYVIGSVLTALYIALIGDVAASVIEYIIRRIRSRKNSKDEIRHIFDHRIGIPLALSVCIAVLAFGIINADNITMDSHEWQTDGLDHDHSFAFASDLHVGQGLSMDALRDLCRQINGSDAEFLILGGDITDELTSYDSMRETYRILSTIDIPVYMIYGNHDRQPSADYVGGRTYTDEQLVSAIEEAGITLLADEFVKVAGDLVLLGREDISCSERKDWSELVNPYDGGALIVADHQPFDDAQLNIEVSALQLSGHTHAGQYWPLQFIYGSLLHLPVCGEYDHPGTHLYVSPGVGGWAPLLRFEGHSGWELITLHP